MRETSVEALLPATRERLREACERDEALASEQPRWVGKPGAWLLASATIATVLMAPLVGSFGHINEHPFASRSYEQALLTAALFTALLLGAFAVRSFVLRRGGLPPGVFLFASGLIEVRGGRVRVWPLERLRRITQPHQGSTRIDLGASGSLMMTTGEEDLAGTLRRTLDRLAQAIDEHDETTLDQLDPCHHEQGRSSFRPLTRPARLPVWNELPGLRRVACLVLALMVVQIGGHLAAMQVRRLSDWLGIDLARRQRDTTSLHSYLWQGGPLADDADRAWVALLADAPDDGALESYMATPYARRVAEVDDLLARRVMRLNLPMRQEDSSLHAIKWRERTSGAIRDLRHYLSIGRPAQPLRPQIEQNVFEMSLALDEALGCTEPDEPLALYLDRSDERGEQARSARWSREKRNMVRCESLSLIESTRSLARTDDQRFTVTVAWISHFEKRRADTVSLVNQAVKECESSEIRAVVTRLGEWQSELWEYLVAHPDAVLHQPPPRWPDERLAPPPTTAVNEARDGQPMLVKDHRVRVLFDRDGGCTPLLLTGWRERDLDALKTPPEGPRLEYAVVGTYGPNDPNVIELTFTMPGRAVRRARFVVPPPRR